MNTGIQKAIETARRIADEYNPKTLIPFPFDKLLKDNSAKIVYRNSSNLGISGAIMFHSNENGYSILINQEEIPERQYFTLAHEIGHLYLHKEYISKNHESGLIDPMQEYDGIMFRKITITPEDRQMEREANNFAAELIMPADKIKDALNATDGELSVEYYAHMFQVSVSAMAIRMEQLGVRTKEWKTMSENR